MASNDRTRTGLTGLALASLLFAGAALAQERPQPPQIVQAGAAEPVTIQISAGLTPKPAFEMPPVAIDGFPGFYFASTGWSWLCSAGGTTKELVLDKRHCGLFTTPARIDQASGRNRPPEEAVTAATDWTRSYQGVFSAFKLANPSPDHDFLALAHGENKNERLGSQLYANTVDRNLSPQACASGYKDGAYTDCWQAYNGFVSLLLGSTKAWQGDAAATTRDLGPILWPAAGYLQGGKKASGGVRHPTAIHDRGFVYIFYLDSSQGSAADRKSGLRLARMPEPDGAATRAPQSLVWFNGAFSPDNPSLPAGFDKTRIAAFYDKPGGRSSELWPDSWQTGHFAVARIRGRKEFLGVEEYIAGKNWGVRLRISPDLMHWSEPVTLPGATSDQGWASGTLHYPAFSDLVGQRSQKIDPAGFYIVGAGTGGQLTRRKIAIR